MLSTVYSSLTPDGRLVCMRKKLWSPELNDSFKEASTWMPNCTLSWTRNFCLCYNIGSVLLKSTRACVNNCATRCNYIQFVISCKLLYMFRVVPPAIIRSAYNCNYSIWYWLNCICYLPLTAEGSRYSLSSTRCCNYSYMCSWWWLEVPPETCRAVYRI